MTNKNSIIQYGQLNLYDYCAYDENHFEHIYINVSGLNTIQFKLNDAKVERNKNLIVNLQTIDEYGNYIKKNLFKLMNLKYKLINENNYVYVHHIDQHELDEDKILDDSTDAYLLKELKIGR